MFFVEIENLLTQGEFNIVHFLDEHLPKDIKERSIKERSNNLKLFITLKDFISSQKNWSTGNILPPPSNSGQIKV